MITSERMAAVDLNAAALGVPQAKLMESAGNAVARYVSGQFDTDTAVALVCGRGNNGGDAFVTARFLSEYEVTVHLLGRPESITTDIARDNWTAIERSGISTQIVSDATEIELVDPDIVVDAMLGTGVTGAPREPVRTAIRMVNDARDGGATVVSVDVPSGIDADTGTPTGGDETLAVRADHVVTFHDIKPGLEDLQATVTVADIGIPLAAERFTGPGDLLGVTRAADSHKGENGTVLVVGGGPYAGAPALTAQAALRAGADLVRVACPSTVASEIQSYSENLIVRSLPGETIGPAHLGRVHELAENHDVVVVGPGIGAGDGTLEFVRQFLESASGRMVVDADALAVVPEVDTAATLICTPHQGELHNMGGETHSEPAIRADLVRTFAEELGITLLVKGATDVISDGETVRRNRTGNPGMTVGGTGDVLAGVVGAIAAVTDPFDAAAIGAYVNGRAGDTAYDELGYGLVATDLINRLPHAMDIHV